MRAFDAKEDLENMRKTYEERRNFLLPKLKELGFCIPINPEGAFYIYAGIERWGLDSMSFVMKALREAKVAITPGYDFGSFRAGSYVRFSYANSLDMLREGCRRLEMWLQSL
jgi:aspartate/methionine/tyrosine aminotransferase